MKYVMFFVLAVSVMACDNSKLLDDEINNQNLFSVKLNNSIKEVINEFISENNLDKSTTFIRLNLGGNSARKVIHLSYGKTAINEIVRLPMNFAFVDGFIIFIYSDIDYLNEEHDNPHLRNFYCQLLESKNINLREASLMSHPPEWQIIKCFDDDSLEINKVFSEKKSFDLPCGYYLKREGKQRNEISIVKE